MYRNADAGIFHFKSDGSSRLQSGLALRRTERIGLVNAERNAAIVGKFDGIRQEVAQNLLQAQAVGMNGCIMANALPDVKLQPFFGSQWSEDFINIIQKRL